MPNTDDLGITVSLSIVGTALFETGASGSIADIRQRITSDFSTITGYTVGTGNRQANLIYVDRRTLVGAAGFESFDLNASGNLADKAGNDLIFTSIKEIIIWNDDPAATVPLQIGGDFIASATSGIVDMSSGTTFVNVQPGGLWHHSSPNTGFTVDTARDGVNVQSAEPSTITYKLFILGVG